MSKEFEEIKKLMEDQREYLTRMAYEQFSSYQTDQICSKRNLNLSLESLLLDDVDMLDDVDTDGMDENFRQELEMIQDGDEECDASPSEQDSGCFSSSDFSLSSSSSSLSRDVSTSSLSRDGLTSSLSRGMSTSSLSRGMSTSSLSRGMSTTSLSRGMSTSNLSRGMSTSSLPRDESTSSLSRDGSTSSLSRDGSTASLSRDMSTSNLSRKESTGSTTSMNTYGNMQDFVIVHTDADSENADKCREDICEDLREENVTIDIFSEIDLGTSELRIIESLHSRYRYILVYVSEHLVDDKKCRFINEILLTIGLKDKSNTSTSKRDRVVPIYTTKENCGIPELEIINGIKYHLRKYKSSKNRYIKSIHNLLKSARKKFPL